MAANLGHDIYAASSAWRGRVVHDMMLEDRTINVSSRRVSTGFAMSKAMKFV
jgi:hypothetical protein